MTFSRKLSLAITVFVIFGLGLILGMWLVQRPLQPVPPNPYAPPTTYKPVEAGEAVVTDVYRKLSPTVVNIVATRLSLNFWQQLMPDLGQGTGFVFDEDGHIITNNHVVANARQVEVTFLGEQKLPARLVGVDPINDIAIIKVDPFPGMKVAPLGDSDALAVGQRVVAIGNPFGFQHTVTAGFVSALNRDITINHRTMVGMIQTDAAINPGNSGGPLINSSGKVIGVNSAIFTQSGGFMGIGLALPINRARKVAQDLISYGRVIYPWAGIDVWMNLSPGLANALRLPPVTGILIFRVAEGSPAQKAGLRGGNRLVSFGGRPIVLGGDVILAVDGVAVPTFDAYRERVLQKEIGDTVTLTILRDGEEKKVDVTLAAAPAPRRL